MKEQNEKKLSKQKRLYWYSAFGCVAVALAVVVIATSVSVSNSNNDDSVNNPPTIEQPDESLNQKPNDTPVEKPDDEPQNKPVDTKPDGFVLPVLNAEVSNEFGFFYNQTLNNYYEHEGYDFVASVGEKVYAVEDGTVESVYTSDVLSGTEIIIDHGNGVKSLYRFVTASENLKSGMTVKKGDVIATVAEANGNEYKDGAHLHFEVLKENKNVDPAEYF